MSYPHLISLSLVVWAVFDPALRRSISRVLVASYALFSPWLIVMATNIGSMASTSAPGGNISFNVILAVCALLGIAFAIHQYRKGDCRFILPLAMLASMLPMVLYYPSRFSIHSVVPLAMLGGIGVVSLARHLSANAGRRGGTVSVLGICLLSLLVLTHGFSYDPSSAAGRSAKDGSPQTYASQRAARSIGAIHGSPTTLCMLISGETLEAPVHESPAYARIIETILGTTGPDDVIVTAQGINGCIITSYTGRATTSGMFREVGADDELALRQAIRGEWQSAIGTDGAGLAFTVIEGAYEGGHVPAAFPYPLAFILVIAGSVLALYDMRKGTGGGP